MQLLIKGADVFEVLRTGGQNHKGRENKKNAIYGWVSGNLWHEITEAYGSVNAFEDHYEFDCAHIFGGPAVLTR